MRNWREAIVIVLSLLAAGLLLVFMKNPLFAVTIFDKDILNFYVGYELSTIFVSISFLLVLYLMADKIKLDYLTLKKIDGPVRPEPFIGLNPKEREGWKTVGLTIGGIITLVTGIVVYFQVAFESGLSFRLFPEVPLVIILALMNSFTEEVIFRLSYTTIIANGNKSPRISEFLRLPQPVGPGLGIKGKVILLMLPPVAPESPGPD